MVYVANRLFLPLLIIADLIYSSRFNRVFLPDFGQRVLLVIILSGTLFYFVLCVIRGHVIPALIVTFIVAFVFFQMNMWTINTGMPFEINGYGQYSLTPAAIVFFMAMRDSQSGYVLKTLEVTALIYAIIFLILSASLMAGVTPPSFYAGILITDAERGYRIFGYGGPLSLIWFIYLNKNRISPSLSNKIMLAIVGAANVITLSRFYLFCWVSVTMAFVLGVPRSWIRIGCLAGLYAASVTLLYGFLDVSWNPFVIFANDSSGQGRALEFQIAKELYRTSPLFGVGLQSAVEQWAALTGLSFFAPVDLGAAGVVFEWGIIGLILYVVASAVVCSPIAKLKPPYRDALFLTGCTLALAGCISPDLFAPGGAFYFAIVLGFYVDQELGSGTSRVSSAARRDGPMRQAAAVTNP